MKKTYIVKSPAKINIGLRVLSKREDGYHNIETIFYPVKIHDTIKLSIKEAVTSKITIQTNLKSQIENKKNICYKAVSLFLKKFKIEKNYEINISINKKIPLGAGLGGGSSNAATVIKIIAKHFKKLNQKKKLNNLALELGSDVPFFILSKPAYATSRGEKLKVLPNFKIKEKILIVNPKIIVSTAQAYKELKAKSSKLKILSKVQRFTLNESLFVNDFEKVVFRKYPKIKAIKDKMKNSGVLFSSMSGSGSTVYGLFDSNNKLRQAEKFFKKKKYIVFVS